MNLNSHISKINSWSDFKQSLENKTKHEKGKAFEELTKYYLEYNPVYHTKLKKVWLQNEIPPTVLKKLNLPTNDQGIDLIAETLEGGYWAIQCKYLQDEDQTLSHRAISTFVSLSTGIANHITHCLVCTTVDDYAKIYKGKTNIGFINSDEWRKLDKEFFDWLRAKHKGKVLKPAAYKPKPHQKKALKEANDYFIKNKNVRGKLVFPCGAGKSLTGYWITRELKANKILVAVPSLSLVKQTLEVYLRESVANNEKVSWLCVCSDEGIGTNDDIAIHTNEIGIPCVTDKDYISNWLKKNNEGKTVIFTTYQSGKTISEACRKAKFEFDLGILDEAHKTVGDKDKAFSHLLFDKNIKINKRIFMTATERRYAGSSDLVLSMDDEEVYGETFAQMSFKEAIDAGILSDYRIITLFISDDEVKKLIENNAFVKPAGKEWNQETEARTLASLIALRKAMTDYPIHHAVTFHSSIKKAEAFDQSQALFGSAYPKFAPVNSYHVSGAMPTSFRGKIVDEFAKSDKAVITNAKCLTEGVDVPNIDCVLFADPRKSTIDIVQAVGRALRKKEGKEFGYVILPVFTKSKSKEEIIESDEFQDILSTLRALASNDERIIEYFRDVSKGVKTAKKDSLIQFEIDVNISQRINEKQLIHSLELKTWDKLAKLSWMPFEEAKAFIHKYNLNSNKEYQKFAKSKKRPLDIPVAPDRSYRQSGWVNWGDFLGTGKIANYYKEIHSYEDAKKLLQPLHLKSINEYKDYIRSLNPSKFVINPDRTFKNSGWVNWGDYLGTNFVATNLREYVSYTLASEYAIKKGIKTNKEWRAHCLLPEFPKDIPNQPSKVYKDKGWLDWYSFLGDKKNEYLDYTKAKSVIIKFGIKYQLEYWDKFRKGELINFPPNPKVYYKNKGWSSWSNFLSNDFEDDFRYISFNELKEVVRANNIKSVKQWKQFKKSDLLEGGIPSHPDMVYKDKGWISWGDFFGTKNHRNIEYLEFTKARDLVRKMKLKNNKEWRVYSKNHRHSNLPGNPDKIYKNQGWISWPDFLGTEK